MKNLIVLMLFLLTAISLSSQDMVKGVVYNDLNRNQVRDKNEPGIPRVAVSNGSEVVLTNAKGEYQLPISLDDIVFVIKPSGYITPVSEKNLPLFYYIHKPLGSPTLEYPGVEPTGNLPKSVDFALFEVEEAEKYDVLLFGDPQPTNRAQLSFFDKRVASELYNVKGPSFGITMGDIVGNRLSLFEPYVDVIQKVGIPWYNVIGNHDMNFDIAADSLSDETFERVFGPSTYSFNAGKTHFIILKNIIRPDPRNSDPKSYWGGFSEKQFAFIENNLKHVPKDHLIVLAFHIPIWEDYVDRDIFRDKDRERLFALLEGFPHTLSISAHSHIQHNVLLTEKDGWYHENPHHHFNIGTTSGAWYLGELDSQGVPFSVMSDGTPQGYATLQIDGNQYNITYKASGYDADKQMNIHHPKVVGRSVRPLSPIYVNFYMGSEQDEVMFRVNDDEWTRMNYTIEFDPSYLQLLHKWDTTKEVIPGRRPREARFCRHLWKAVLPADLEVGEHTIEVRVKDMFGNLHFGKSSYRVDVAK